MKRLAACVGVAAASLFLATACRQKASPSVPQETAPSALNVPPETDPLAQGLWWLYHLQYEKARQAFQQFSEAHPSDPSGYFYQTATDWWQLAQDFELSQPDIAKRFKQDSEKTIQVASALEKSKDKTKQANAFLYEGGAWGLRGRFEVTQRHWLDAYRAGKRGRARLKKALSIDPDLNDAYLGLGIYDYYADTLKGVQAVLSSLLMHGDRRRGIQEIRRALEKGKRADVEARLFLIDIYATWEKQPAKAVALAQELREKYPQSPAMHLAVISALAADHEWPAMKSEAEQFLKLAREEAPYYTKRHIPAGLYYTGLGALHEGQPDLCIQHMNEILHLEDVAPESRWITFATLRRGEAYEAEGNREKALADYTRVLARPNVWESHDEASRHVTSAAQRVSK